MLPKLGIEPLDPNEACKENVMEFVSVLSSLAPKTASRGNTACKDENSTQTATASVGKIVQTSGQHIVRCNLESLVGEWQPLDVEMVRRGNYLKCVDPVRTANAEGSNLHLAPEDMLRVVSQDADKDIQVVLLTPLRVSNLWAPSGEKYWILQADFDAFLQLVHPAASCNAAQTMRASRRSSVEEHESSEC